MSKSIASKTLAIVKKQEEERLGIVKENFLDIMRKEFEKRVINCNPWPEASSIGYRTIFDDFSVADLEVVCKELGFKFRYSSDVPRSYFLCIPRYVKGEKRTQAQLMLYRSNSEIKKRIKFQRQKAKEISKEALEKIKKGDFTTLPKHYSSHFEILVTVSYTDDSLEFKKVVKDFFEKKKLHFGYIDTRSNELKLVIP